MASLIFIMISIALASLLSLSFYFISLQKKFIKKQNLNVSNLVLSRPTNTFRLPEGTVLTSNPANVDHVLKTRFNNYLRGEDLISTLSDFFGHGIFNSDGDHWRLQRKTASLEFSTKTIRTYVIDSLRFEVVERLLPLLESAAVADQTLDLQDVLDRFALDNVCKVAFGMDPSLLVSDPDEHTAAAQFAHAFERANEITLGRFQIPNSYFWRILRFLNLGSERKLRKEMEVVNDFAMRVVRERRAKRKSGGGCDARSLLCRFLDSEDEYSDEFLRDMVISFVIAGKDTTSTGMMRFFLLVADRPEVQEKIVDEIRRARAAHGGRSGEAFSLDELRGMDYLHAAVSEALRLYPPVSMGTRMCGEDDVLPDGTKMKKGDRVLYNIYAMGRMESIWGEDCKEFKPERWLDENGGFQGKSPYNFMVFNSGPRICLGKEMAYIQMKAVVASVMERFVIEVVDDGTRDYDDFNGIGVRLEHGLPVKVRTRDSRSVHQ